MYRGLNGTDLIFVDEPAFRSWVGPPDKVAYVAPDPSQFNAFSFRGRITWKHFFISIFASLAVIIAPNAWKQAMRRSGIEMIADPNLATQQQVIAGVALLLNLLGWWIIAASIVKRTRG